jgi:hypothetical protein
MVFWGSVEAHLTGELSLPRKDRPELAEPRAPMTPSLSLTAVSIKFAMHVPFRKRERRRRPRRRQPSRWHDLNAERHRVAAE